MIKSYVIPLSNSLELFGPNFPVYSAINGLQFEILDFLFVFPQFDLLTKIRGSKLLFLQNKKQCQQWSRVGSSRKNVVMVSSKHYMSRLGEQELVKSRTFKRTQGCPSYDWARPLKIHRDNTGFIQPCLLDPRWQGRYETYFFVHVYEARVNRTTSNEFSTG